MLPDEFVKFESFRLEDGRKSYRMTHLPTGLRVDGLLERDQPVFKYLSELANQLETLVKKSEMSGPHAN
jgi:hypothetical protein